MRLKWWFWLRLGRFGFWRWIVVCGFQPVGSRTWAWRRNLGFRLGRSFRRFRSEPGRDRSRGLGFGLELGLALGWNGGFRNLRSWLGSRLRKPGRYGPRGFQWSDVVAGFGIEIGMRFFPVSDFLRMTGFDICFRPLFKFHRFGLAGSDRGFWILFQDSLLHSFKSFFQCPGSLFLYPDKQRIDRDDDRQKHEQDNSDFYQ